jgi:S-adenosylmethionine hydrolase
MEQPLVTLTTDFGRDSSYVGQMKGVLLSGCPGASIHDLSHSIRPQHVREAAIFLADTTPWFSADTLHVAVVDPGVGTSRRIVYVECDRQRYLAPDNGLLSRVLLKAPPTRVISLKNRKYWRSEVSNTFHGRDIFASVAAHLCLGLDPTGLGPEVDDLQTLDWAIPTTTDQQIVGEVICVDSFGNLLTNITVDQLVVRGPESERVVECQGRRITGVCNNYGNRTVGELIALFDSHLRLEIAVVNGNAAQQLDAREGTTVIVY